MVYYRACPRCRGDVHIREDFYGVFKECLQCGYMLDIDQGDSQPFTWANVKQKPGRKGKAA